MVVQGHKNDKKKQMAIDKYYGTMQILSSKRRDIIVILSVIFFNIVIGKIC